MQLKIFGHDRDMNRGLNIVLDLIIEEEINKVLIETHVGDSPDQGHYVCAVKNGDNWYTCNDDQMNLGVLNLKVFQLLKMLF